jgi:uncharacterized protein
VRIFFDSSAFVKRYVREAGTDAVLDLCDRADELVLSVIAVPEIMSAFCRLRRQGKLSEADYDGLKRDLMADVVDAVLCDVAQDIVAKSIESLEGGVLRGMDAIHVGTACIARCDLFVSSDARQCEAAIRAGLAVERV